jgi:imidazoleglycerol phosphate synthase cyclase subunit/phosphoribosyl-ATP pyrophosphohydrolase
MLKPAAAPAHSGLMTRVIPCLDVKDGRVVKGVKFEALKDQGDPVEAARAEDAQGADELVFLDISATVEGRRTILDVVERVADQVFIPLTVGGGVSDVEHARDLLMAGADKVAVNSAAVKDPSLLSRLASRFGSQCVVLAVDARRAGDRWEVFTRAGKTATGKDAVQWCVDGVAAGAGEILLTSIDKDGTKSGYDTELLRAVRAAVRVPVVASGGAGSPQHFVDAVNAGASAVLAAGLFHEKRLSILEVKRALDAAGLPVRLPRREPLPLDGTPKFDDKGLLPAILVDAASGEVLTLAYMNAESLARTRETHETWLFSRSRNELWHKGATSGHTQEVLSLSLDCDADALVVRVLPRGPACHNGTRSCFASPAGGAMVLLDDVLAARARDLPEKSYTAQLLKDDNKRIKKIGEETAELLRALHVLDDDAVAEEAADLIFHVAVALRARGVPLAKVLEKLRARAR